MASRKSSSGGLFLFAIIGAFVAGVWTGVHFSSGTNNISSYIEQKEHAQSKWIRSL